MHAWDFYFLWKIKTLKPLLKCWKAAFFFIFLFALSLNFNYFFGSSKFGFNFLQGALLASPIILSQWKLSLSPLFSSSCLLSSHENWWLGTFSSYQIRYGDVHAAENAWVTKSFSFSHSQASFLARRWIKSLRNCFTWSWIWIPSFMRILILVIVSSLTCLLNLQLFCQWPRTNWGTTLFCSFGFSISTLVANIALRTIVFEIEIIS